MSGWLAIILVVVLLLANAFFVAAEFTLVSAREDRLEALVERGYSRARIVINASKRISLMLSGAQLGITICSLLLGRLGEPTVASALRELFSASIPAVILQPLSFAIALTFITILHVLVGEMVPKNLVIAEPERLALWLVPVHVAWVKLANPFIWLLNLLANSVVRMMRVQPRDELDTAYNSTELAELLSESREEGLLHHSEHRRLSQTLSSARKTVRDVLIPLTSLTTLPQHPTIGDVERVVSATGYSRFPIRAADGALTGYVHVKDILDQLDVPASQPLPPNKTRGLTTLSGEARLDEAVSVMRAEGSHLAQAFDESGMTVGVVAFEDVVEEYVGTVRDGTHVDR